MEGDVGALEEEEVVMVMVEPLAPSWLVVWARGELSSGAQPRSRGVAALFRSSKAPSHAYPHNDLLRPFINLIPMQPRCK